MTRPVILLDVDGVLANFVEANLRTLRSLGIHREHDDVTTWEMAEALGLDDTARAIMEFRWSLPGFCASLPPYDGAVAGVESLRGLGDVFAVTAPMFTPHWQHERTEWLVEHFAFRRKDVISTHAKWLVRGDVMVDDKPAHVEAWSAAWPQGQAFCWARPYNEAFIGLRTSDWRVIAGAAAMRAARAG